MRAHIHLKKCLLAHDAPPEYICTCWAQAALDAERWLSEHMQGQSDAEEEESEDECHPEDYEGWTMKQIRKELKDRGVDTAAECRGCNVRLPLQLYRDLGTFSSQWRIKKP